MNNMKLVELVRGYLSNKINARTFSEDICVERRKLYGVKDQDKDKAAAKTECNT